MSAMKLAEDVAELIDVPLDQWPGNCHAIASMMLRYGALNDMPMAGKPKLVYGHWTGPVAENTVFSERLVVPHGWIEVPSESLPGGLIVDPTRWYFEGKPPYIYVGRNDHYDLGGSVWRNSLHEQQPPECVPGKGEFPLPEDEHVAGAIRSLVLCNCDENRLNIDQLYWLGNLDPELMEPHTLDIYLWLNNIDQKAIIPIDYWNYYMEPAYDPGEDEGIRRAEEMASLVFNFPGSFGPHAGPDPDDEYERFLEDLYWDEAAAADDARSAENE